MLKKKISEIAYRLKIRKALSDNSNELVQITYEECIKEMKRRKMKI